MAMSELHASAADMIGVESDRQIEGELSRRMMLGNGADFTPRNIDTTPTFSVVPPRTPNVVPRMVELDKNAVLQAVGDIRISPRVTPRDALSESSTALMELLGPVIKIYCNHVHPNYSMPWQMRRQQKSTSSGFAISGRRILTNAHSVEFHTSVRVRKFGSAIKFNAKVLHIGHECDLAVLTVHDDEFWKDLPFFEFGDVPQLQDAVTVVGYPTGGDNISVTKGVVSRLDVTEYTFANFRLLALQIDAAINSGNSGGPAIKDGKVIGVAFETLNEAENIGYIIPVPVIRHFLHDIAANGRYTGFCGTGFSWQLLESVHMKKYLGLSEKQTGIVVNEVYPLSAAQGVLQKDDVILAVDHYNIADDGTIEFRRGDRVLFVHAITIKFSGETCRMQIFRNGKLLEVNVTLSNPTPLVPVHTDGTIPNYIIYGGLVFVPLNRPYLVNEYGKSWEKKAPIRLCDMALHAQKTYQDEEAVVLTQVLAGEVNVGYHHVGNIQLTSLNGQAVRNMKHLKQLIENCKESFIRFDLQRDKMVVLMREEVEKNKDEIMREHSIHALMSASL